MRIYLSHNIIIINKGLWNNDHCKASDRQCLTYLGVSSHQFNWQIDVFKYTPVKASGFIGRSIRLLFTCFFGFFFHHISSPLLLMALPSHIFLINDDKSQCNSRTRKSKMHRWMCALMHFGFLANIFRCGSCVLFLVERNDVISKLPVLCDVTFYDPAIFTAETNWSLWMHLRHRR